jgi:hypothetical protein
MGLTPLAADSARRILEVIHYTIFLHHRLIWSGNVSISDWERGAQVYQFCHPLEVYYRSRATAAGGPFGETFTSNLFQSLSAYVHAHPTKWGEAREGLELRPTLAEVARAERNLTDAAKVICYIVLLELSDLSVDDIDSFFGTDWSAVMLALGLA